MTKYLALGFWLLCAACTGEYSPRPKEYPHIALLEKTYVSDSLDGCPFTFQRLTFVEVQRDSQLFGAQQAGDCWFNLYYPNYDATVYLSYKTLTESYNLSRLRDDAYRLTYEHTKRADYIEPAYIETPRQVYGVVYDVGGDAASPLQFFVTDTTRHWLRGALYFDIAPNYDSLAPVINYIRQDVGRFLETLVWQDYK
jgi:gliding motility-associated lipoprotein GldD